MSQVNKNDGKIARVKLQIATIYSRSGPQRLLAIFADLEKMLAGKKFCSNEEAIIAESEAHFEAKDRSFSKHGIEKLEKRWKKLC